MDRIQIEKIMKYRKLITLADKLKSMNLMDDGKLVRAVATDIFTTLIKEGVRPLEIVMGDYSHILSLTNAEW